MTRLEMQRVVGVGVLVVLGAAAVLVYASTYTIDEAEQAVVVQFGEPRRVVQEPGLHFKLPFVQEVRRFDRRLQAWDGDPNQIPTKGREFIWVDTTARWRIVEPQLFLESLRDVDSALSRLDGIINSAVRDHVSEVALEEIIRSEDWDPDVQVIEAEELEILEAAEDRDLREAVRIGREELSRQIAEVARRTIRQFGIDLMDVRIKRVSYVDSVQREVFERMIAERERIAAEFRSEGEGRKAEILGRMERDLSEVRSEAERRAQVIRGGAEAEAARIYAEAYGSDEEFYGFYRTLQSR